MKTDISFRSLRKQETIWRAWYHVRAKAKKSGSAEIRAESIRFANFEQRNINRIIEQIRKGKFQFLPAKPILIRKAGKKSKRPVVIAPIESRIVQRALLDVIQSAPGIHALLTEGYNFGGVDGHGFGVPAAVHKASSVAKEKAYYVRTDIKSFFVKVPRKSALDCINRFVLDEPLRDFLKKATDTELIDCERLGDDVRLFPLSDDGVAQGSCLSPLLCNLLLSDFDRKMNGRGVVCIRYIDDFILFAKDKKTARQAMRSAKEYLAFLGLDIYDPMGDSEEDRAKADCGEVSGGFDFLGCTIKGDRITPKKSSMARLREKVKDVFDSSLLAMRQPETIAGKHETYADAVRTAGLIIRSWGETYSFCTDHQALKEEDGNLRIIFQRYNERTKTRLAKVDDLDKRRILGLSLLQDCSIDRSPI